MKIEKPIVQYEVDYICNMCKKGKMRPTGEQLLIYPPVYPHKCTECGYKQNFKEMYPYATYKNAK